jgi:hypothetical protein
MSQRSQDNAVIRAIKAKLAVLESDERELLINKKMISTLRDTSEDDRVRFNATKLIHETEMRIAELRLKTEEYENPVTQKSEVTHLTPIPMNLTVTIAKDK